MFKLISKKKTIFLLIFFKKSKIENQTYISNRKLSNLIVLKIILKFFCFKY